MNRGEIRYENSNAPQRFGIINSHRPVVIVGITEGNAVQVVPLTTSPAKMIGCNTAYHVQVISSGKPCIALADQIRTVPKSEIGSALIGRCTAKEIAKIDACLCSMLGIPNQVIKKQTSEAAALNLRMIAKLAAETAKELDQ